MQQHFHMLNFQYHAALPYCTDSMPVPVRCCVLSFVPHKELFHISFAFVLGSSLPIFYFFHYVFVVG